MNLNTPQIHTGPLVAADFDEEPWGLPHWMTQIEDERRQHEAAHAATEVGQDDGLPPFLSDGEKALLVLIAVASTSIVAAVALWVWKTLV